ncbi:MAG: hypothetical protein DWQ31_16160 [Planctomycetota bacterium]|nr:MAG: hypothetical protein DWQ31_16160 [Planctomycetota bacterium]REJ95834.1 MAG: hypothetical protein DWQ35_05675 [Planctomycetota bacterium]
MRQLSASEQSDLERRKAQFDSFLAERMPVLTDFMKCLEFSDGEMVLVEADRFLPALDEFMQNQEIDLDDRNWIMTRIGYFIGEWLVQRYGGCWFINESPESPTFLRYVVGQFAGLSNPRAVVDPFQVADVFISQPPPRSLIQATDELEAELQTAKIY